MAKVSKIELLECPLFKKSDLFNNSLLSTLLLDVQIPPKPISKRKQSQIYLRSRNPLISLL